jgi:hypothetical protein
MNADSGYKGVIGTVPKVISTTIGDVNLQPDKFMKADPARLLTDGATSSKAPAAPTDGVGPTLAVDALSKYQASEVGNVYYAVSAVNRYGESALTLMNATATTLAVGSSVDMIFTATAGPNSTSGFKIYRTKVTTAGTATGLQFYPIISVSTADLATGYDGAAALAIRDRGRILPDMEQAFITEMVDEVLSFKQLAPISKLDLAVLSMSRRFIAFLFATPNLYTPKKFVRYVNCAKALVA